MKVVTSYTISDDDDKRKAQDQQPFWEKKSFQKDWEEVYVKSNAYFEVSSSMLLLDSKYIVEHKPLDYKELILSDVSFIYVCNMWGSNHEYQAVCNVGISYEIYPREGWSN